MSAWVSIPSDDTSGSESVYERPLGPNEIGFFWDREFADTADSTTRLIVEDLSESNNTFSEQLVQRAWISLKQRFPLLGARLDERAHEDIHFVVRSSRITSVVEGELNFRPASPEVEGESLVDELLNGPAPLSRDLLCRLYFMPCSDSPRRWNFVILIAHVITDGMAHNTLTREFLNTLASMSSSVILPEPPRLIDRLSMVVSAEHLAIDTAIRAHPRQRWRRAIATVLRTIHVKKMVVSQLIAQGILRAQHMRRAAGHFRELLRRPPSSRLHGQRGPCRPSTKRLLRECFKHAGATASHLVMR